MYNNYQDPNKDSRISFLSIFSSLCSGGNYANTEKGIKDGAEFVKEIAFKLNDELYAKYPITSDTPTPAFKPATAPIPASGSGKNCPVCQSPMVRQYNKKNPLSPDWKCSNKICKYQWKGGVWIPSKYTTGAWDEKPEVINRANHQDNLDDEAHKHYGEGLPPEFGG